MTRISIKQQILNLRLFHYRGDVYYLKPRYKENSTDIAFYLLYKYPTAVYVGIIDPSNMNDDYMKVGRDFLGCFISGKVFFHKCTISKWGDQ